MSHTAITAIAHVGRVMLACASTVNLVETSVVAVLMIFMGRPSAAAVLCPLACPTVIRVRLERSPSLHCSCICTHSVDPAAAAASAQPAPKGEGASAAVLGPEHKRRAVARITHAGLCGPNVLLQPRGHLNRAAIPPWVLPH